MNCFPNKMECFKNSLSSNECDYKEDISYLNVITNVTDACTNGHENSVKLQINKEAYHNLRALIQNLFHRLLSTANYFNRNKILATQKKYLQKGTIHKLEKNSSDWEYIWASNSACINYNSTAIDNDVISSLNYCITDERYNITAAMCIVLELFQDCSFDVRLQRSRNRPYENIWDMPCGKLQQHVSYKNGICYNREDKMF